MRTGRSNITIPRAWAGTCEEEADVRHSDPRGTAHDSTARAEADAERVYLMGFGEQWQHFHFMLLSRSVTTPEHLRGAGLFEGAPGLADREGALRIGSRMRKMLAAPA